MLDPHSCPAWQCLRCVLLTLGHWSQGCQVLWWCFLPDMEITCYRPNELPGRSPEDALFHEGIFWSNPSHGPQPNIHESSMARATNGFTRRCATSRSRVMPIWVFSPPIIFFMEHPKIFFKSFQWNFEKYSKVGQNYQKTIDIFEVFGKTENPNI